MNKILTTAVALAAAGWAHAAAVPEEVPEGATVLILQVGSDWCVAGDPVQQVFESAAFGKLIPDTAIHSNASFGILAGQFRC